MDSTEIKKRQNKAAQLKEDGNEFYKNNEYNNAIEMYEASIEAIATLLNDKTCRELIAIAKSNIAQCYLQKKEYKMAMEASLDAIEMMPEHFRSYCHCSTAALGLNMKQLAVYSVEKGLARATEKKTLKKEMEKLKVSARSAYEDMSARLAEDHRTEESRHNYLGRLNLRIMWGFHFRNRAMNEEDSDIDDVSEEEGSKPKMYRPSTTKAAAARGTDRSSDYSGDDCSRPSTPLLQDAPKAARRPSPTKKSKKEQELPKKGGSIGPHLQQDSRRKPSAEHVQQEAVKKATLDQMREDMVKKENNQQVQQEYQQLIVEGSMSMQNKVPRTCVDKMVQALDILNTRYSSLMWSQNNSYEGNLEVVTVKYVYGRACIETNCYETIVMGRIVLDTILTQHKGVRFPAVYLGFGLLYKKLNRYEMGLEYVNRGLDYLDRGFAADSCSWPGLPLQPLLETIMENLDPYLRKLQLELRTSPRPDAVCKLADCTQHATHILPSENIYFSDPDYRGFFRVYCRDNCVMDYHRACWVRLKESFTAAFKLARPPTERDFFGKECFTPDCVGLIYKIMVYEQDGSFTTLQDKAVEEELEKRKEIKQRREPDSKSKGKMDIKKFKKIKSGPPKHGTTSEGGAGNEKESDNNVVQSLGGTENNKENTNANIIANHPVGGETQEPIDYSAIDVSNAVVIKKKKNRDGQLITEEEEEESRRRKKGSNKKTVLSLDEFIGNQGFERHPENWPGNNQSGADTFGDRVARSGAYRAFLEGDVELKNEGKITARPPDISRASFSSQGWTSSNRTSESSSPLMDDHETMTESILTYLYDLLKNNGPQLCTDSMSWLNLSREAEKLVGGREGLADFLKADERDRFSVYKDKYICITADLTKAIRMHNAEEMPCKIIDIGVDSLGQHQPGGLAVQARAMRAKLLDGQSAVLSAQPAQLSFFNGPSSVHCGVQTDVSSLDLEEYNDSFTLQQTINQLTEELQQARDRLFQSQKDKKIEIKELQDQTKGITEDLKRSRGEAQQAREEVLKLRKICQETGEKERELKAALESLEAGKQRIRLLERKVEEEQELSFKLSIRQKQDHDEIKKLRINEATSLAMHKEFRLQAEAQICRQIIDYRAEQTRRTIAYLTALNVGPASQPLLNQMVNELNRYAAGLITAKDELDQLVVDKVRRVSERPDDVAVSLDFDLKRVELPPVGHELVPLLLSVAAASAPPPLHNNHMVLGGMPLPMFHTGVSERAGGVSVPVPPPPGMFARLPFEYRGRPHSFAESSSFSGLANAATFGPASPVKNVPSATLARPSSSPGPSGSGSRPPGLDVPPPRPASNPSPAVARPSSAPFMATIPVPSAGAAVKVTAGPSSRPSSVASVTFPGPSAGSSGAAVNPGQSGVIGAAAAANNSAGLGAVARPRNDVAAGNKLKKNHDKLLNQLTEKFPVLTEASANRYIQQLRQSNGGRLSGMSMTEIFERVGKFIRRDSDGQNRAVNDLDSDECTICLDKKQNIWINLDPCGHRFHKHCIGQWLQLERSGNTCPICRTFVTRDDEFPSLS